MMTSNGTVGDATPAPKDVLKVTRVVKNGVVQNWDDFELLLKHILHTELGLPEDLSEYPVCVSASSAMLCSGLNADRAAAVCVEGSM